MELERIYPAEPSRLGEIREFIASCADREGLGELVTDLQLAVCEACTNVAMHGRSPDIVLTWRSLPDGVEINVRDRGVFVPPAARPGQADIGQRGMQIMIGTMDEVTIRGGTPERPGTLVRLVKRRSPGGAPPPGDR